MMKKSNLFTFVLVLILTFNFTFSYANDQVGLDTIVNDVTEKEENLNDIIEDPDKEELPQEEAEVVQPVAPVVPEITEAEKKAAIEQENKVKQLNAVKSFVRSKNNVISDGVVTKVAESAIASSSKNDFDLTMILSIMWKESTFYPTVSNGGCYGLMQISSSTGKGFGYTVNDLKDPYRNAELGARIIKGHIQNFNDTIKGLSAYNAGSGNVKKGNYNTSYAKNILEKQKVVKAYLDSSMSK